MPTHINPFKQNNDHTRKMCKVRFRSSFENLTNFTGKQLCWSFFLITLETSAHVFSYEICEIFKNTFFHRTALVAAFTGFQW